MIFERPAGPDVQLVSHCATDGDEVPQLRDKVVRIEKAMLEMPQVEIPPRHFFAKGLYAREITIPKGVLATSAIHLFEHIDIIAKGDISVLTDEGVKRIQAPATFVSQPGLKRIGYAHEDTVWISIIACEERDLEKIEETLVVGSYEEFALAQKRMEGQAWPLLSRQ